MTNTKNTQLLGILLSAAFVSACAGTSMENKPTNNTVQKPSASTSANSLTAYTWQLASYQAAGAVASTQLKAGEPTSRYQLAINEGRAVISGGCNVMSGALTLGPNNSFSIGPLRSTMRACFGTLGKSDNEVKAYLSKASQYAINNHTLTLSAKTGEKLTFKGTETPETKYGGKGVRKFIELNSTAKGVVWREAKYDAKWIRIKDNAKWQSNFPGIEGFKPEVNMHYIVRLFEFTDPKTQKPVWVKDMVTTTGRL